MRLNRRSKWMVFAVMLPMLLATVGITLLSVFRPMPFYYKNHGGDQYAAWSQGGRLILSRASPSLEYFMPELRLSPDPRFDPWPNLTRTYLAPHLVSLPRSQAASAAYVVHGVQIPYWIIGLPIVLIALWITHRSGWIVRPNTCGNCRYDLSACGDSICPECGHTGPTR